MLQMTDDHFSAKVANDNINAALIRERLEVLEEFARNSVGDPENEPYIATTMIIARQLRDSLKVRSA